MNIQETQKPGDKQKLRLERHRIALEKLQLSWMKKTLTLSALGFTSYRFFYSRMEAGKAPLFELFDGRSLGIFLVSLGIIGLLQATIQHVRNYAALKTQDEKLGYSVALIQSVILLLLFLVVLVVIFQKL